jgi:hypothetical protein
MNVRALASRGVFCIGCDRVVAFGQMVPRIGTDWWGMEPL